MASTKQTAGGSTNGNGIVRSILVVDDDPGIVGFLELALADEGYAVRAAANGKEALDRMDEQPPDLVLLDMNMPVMDGWEFCDTLRARDSTLTSIPIVVMTAARDAASRSREVKAQGYLGKPFDLDHLFKTIDSLLPAH
jgi:two-component system, chemotaxis family, chemotaxis protein CheY